MQQYILKYGHIKLSVINILTVRKKYWQNLEFLFTTYYFILHQSFYTVSSFGSWFVQVFLPLFKLVHIQFLCSFPDYVCLVGVFQVIFMQNFFSGCCFSWYKESILVFIFYFTSTSDAIVVKVFCKLVFLILLLKALSGNVG